MTIRHISKFNMMMQCKSLKICNDVYQVWCKRCKDWKIQEYTNNKCTVVKCYGCGK